MTSSKIQILLLGILLVGWIGGCHPNTMPEDIFSLEKLLPQTSRYIANCESDSLLHLTNEVIQQTPAHSEAHFFAQGLKAYLPSLQHDIPLAADRLDKLLATHDTAAYPYATFRLLYYRMRCHREIGDFAGGTITLHRLLTLAARLTPTLTTHRQNEVRRYCGDGLLQLMYCYFIAEKSPEGLLYFQQLMTPDSALLPVPETSRRRVMLLTAYLTMQCGKSMEAVELLEKAFHLPLSPSVEEMTADYTFAGSIYSQANGHFERSVEMYEKAIELLRTSKEQSSLPWVLTNLGELYASDGQFDRAVQMYFQAIPIFEKIGYHEGTSTTYSTLSALYLEWEMPREADHYADLSLHYARLSGHIYTQGESLSDKSYVAEYRGLRDSAFYWIRLADSCYQVAETPVERLSTQGTIGRFLLNDPNRTAEGVALLQQVCADTLIRQSPYEPIYRFMLGEGYVLQGKTEEGILLIQSTLPEMESGHRNLHLVKAYNRLSTHYAAHKQYEQALSYREKERILQQELFNASKLHQITASRIAFDTGRKEQENQTLIAKVSLKQRTLTFTWVVAGLLITLLCSVGLYLRQRQRYHRRISETRLAQISSLLGAQQDLHRNNQTLTEELEEVSRRKTTGNVRVQLSTHIFNPDEEANFRRTFTSLYPDYLPSLHQRCPELTRTDELIAMLLLLDLSNDEIALTLGIAKASVNRARSRLRKRLGLVETGVVLEEYLKGIIIHL